MTGEEDAVKGEGLALEPIRRREEADHARHRGARIRPRLPADATTAPGAEQMIDDLEALVPHGIIDAANVDETAEAALRIVAQELHRARQLLARQLERHLAMGDLPGSRREPIVQIVAELVQIHALSKPARPGS